MRRSQHLEVRITVFRRTSQTFEEKDDSVYGGGDESEREDGTDYGTDRGAGSRFGFCLSGRGFAERERAFIDGRFLFCSGRRRSSSSAVGLARVLRVYLNN